MAGLVLVTSLARASMLRTFVISRPCPFHSPVASTSIATAKVALIVMVFLRFVTIPLLSSLI